MTSLIKHVQALKPLLQNKSKSKILKLKYSSAIINPSKLTVGPNGERIISSQDESLNIPKISVPEYVWGNYTQYQNKIAVQCGITGRKYTYAEARDASNYFARSLRKMGFKKGDVIAIVLANVPEYAIALLGSMEAGLVVTTVNPIYTAHEIVRQLQNSDATGVITSDDIASTVREAMTIANLSQAPFITVKTSNNSLPEGSISFTEMISKGKSLPNVDIKDLDVNDIAVMPYSSGTTGLPKGVVLTHNNLVTNMEMVEQTVGDELWGPTTETFQDVLPLILPMYHSYGMNCLLLPRLTGGSKIVTLSRFTPEDYMRILQEQKATMLSIVPPIFLFLSMSPQVTKKHFDSVKFILSGAAPIAESDVLKFYERFGADQDKLKFVQGYGLTETSPVSTLELSKCYKSIGRAIKGCHMRIVDNETGKDVKGPNEVGEFWIKGPHIMKGYLKNEKATKESMCGDWFKTGDMGYYDDTFNFYITDRMKELIKVKGFQVAPAELEGILRTHPDIVDAAIIGIPDPRSGEAPKAFLVKKQGSNLKEDDIQNFMKGKVSEFKELRGGVQFLDEIPKNPTGKIMRAELKKRYVKQN